MATLHLILLVALPLCYAQFSIQGPSDGSRRSQGLKYDAQKGIQYDDQSASLDTGDFSIQGASDGNSNFNIQGASDGNSNFQIQGASDGNANFQIQGASDGNANFQIQGASDGNANFQIRGATDDNSNFRIQVPTNGDDSGQTQNTYGGNRGPGKSLQYQDPSGLQVNWKSYQPTARAQQQLQQQQDDYVPAPVAPPRRKGPRRQQQVQQQAQQPVQQQEESEPALKNYKVFDKAPPTIMQILQFQQQIPYLNSIPEHLRYDFRNAAAANAPQAQTQEEPVEEIQRPLRNREKPRGSARQKRLAQQKNQRQRIATQPQYAEPQPQLSTNVPSQIQDILHYQAKIPYLNHIPEQWRYEALLKKEGAQIQPQYQRQPEPEPIRHSQKVRQRRQAQKQQQQQQYQEPQPHYNTNVPSHLQQILRFQSQVPYTNVIPEQFRYEKLAAAAQGHRQRRQAPKYQSQVDLSQYQRVSQPSIDTLPKYSTNLPGPIKQLLQYQSQAPYDIIANRINYKLDKPYVPQPIVPAPISQIPQTNPRPIYKPIQQQQQQQPAQPIYQQPQPQPQLQSQFQPSQQFPYQQQQPLQRPVYQLAQNQYNAPSQQQKQQQQQQQYLQAASTQLQRPIYQPFNQGQVGQYQQNNKAVLSSAPQSQLIRAQNHPNAISQYNNQAGLYGQPANIIRPVTENQY